MAYSDYFQFNLDPTLKKQFVGTGSGLSSTWNNYRDVITPGLGTGYDWKTGKTAAATEFDKMMAGNDQASQAYIDQLKGIYDQYGKYAEEYKGNVKPIIDAIGGDITGMQTIAKKYGETLKTIEPTMMTGIQVDPNAARTRNEYIGAVADQMKSAEKQQRIAAESQGLNPYANTGANREMALARGAGVANAANRAYTDWRKNYNADIKAQQDAQAKYAGLVAGEGALVSDIAGARGAQAGLYGKMSEADIGAAKLKQAGLSDLLGVQEARRQEALQLGQQQQSNIQRESEIMADLRSKQKNQGNVYGSWL